MCCVTNQSRSSKSQSKIMMSTSHACLRKFFLKEFILQCYQWLKKKELVALAQVQHIKCDTLTPSRDHCKI